jgi:rhodanese-related sulfurtransferase
MKILKKSIFNFAILMAILPFISCATQNDKPVSYKNSFLVDVRSPEEFASGTAQGAINIPFDQVANHLDTFKNKKQIVVFCKSGGRSSQAKATLEQKGFKNVTNGINLENVNRFLKE